MNSMKLTMGLLCSTLVVIALAFSTTMVASNTSNTTRQQPVPEPAIDGELCLAAGEHLDGDYTEFFLNATGEDVLVNGTINVSNGVLNVYARNSLGDVILLGTFVSKAIDSSINNDADTAFVIAPNQPVVALMVDPLTEAHFSWNLDVAISYTDDTFHSFNRGMKLVNAIAGVGQTGQDKGVCGENATAKEIYLSLDSPPNVIKFTGYGTLYDPIQQKTLKSDCDVNFTLFDKAGKKVAVLKTDPKKPECSTKTVSGTIKNIIADCGPDDGKCYFSWTIN
ncbi:MAG: hypothetical protein AB1489_41910 [Acidobacteriota bacterium]